jgi:hypothetical protein
MIVAQIVFSCTKRLLDSLLFNVTIILSALVFHLVDMLIVERRPYSH